MTADRIAAILAGVLYLLGIVAGVLSVVPVIDTPDYLIQISAMPARSQRERFSSF
jgi:hypothetical protein